MANVNFTHGLDHLGVWATGTFKFALMKDTYTPDSSHQFMSSVVAGSTEVSVSGYVRQTVTGKTRTPNTGTGRIYYDADNPNFGTLGSGQDAGGLLLFHFVTNDSDSVPVTFLDMTDIDTSLLDPFIILLSSSGVAFIAGF